MLTVYSIPPVDDIRLVEYLPQHIWVFIDNKHYDAENPNGVNSPWELLIFKKYFKKNQIYPINLRKRRRGFRQTSG